MKNIITLFLFTQLILSCEKTVEIGGIITNYYTNEPISDIPVSIFICDSNEVSFEPFNWKIFKLIETVYTNKQGQYIFEVKEDENLYQYFGFFKKTSDFDSTHIQWKYYFDPLNSDTYASDFDFSKTNNGFKLKPAGKFNIEITNLNAQDTIEVLVNEWSLTYPKTSITKNFDFELEPSKTYLFEFYEIINKERSLIETKNIYIKNSFDSESTSEKESLNTHTIEIELNNL